MIRRNLSYDKVHFDSPHMDSGTLTILFRSHDENDGLEIADIETTRNKTVRGLGWKHHLHQFLL